MTKPIVEGTGFGFIDVDGERISHDILIRLDGEVIKRKKKLSKEIYGTSHTISWKSFPPQKRPGPGTKIRAA